LVFSGITEGVSDPETGFLKLRSGCPLVAEQKKNGW